MLLKHCHVFCLTTFIGVSFLFASAARADVIVDWNNITIETIRADTSLPGPVHSARVFAMVHAAMYDAVNSVTPTHEAYLTKVATATETSAEAAAIEAAYTVLVNLYPARQSVLDASRAESLAAIPEGLKKESGLSLGEYIGEQMLLARAFDNALEVVPYTPGTDPGNWRPSFPDFSPGYAPHWNQVKPFVLPGGAMFRPPPPPALDSPEYTAAYNEVKEFGELNSAVRTADQTEIGLFWAYDVGTFGPPTIQKNQNLQQIVAQMGNTFSETARLFALMNLAMADAGCVAWEAKYTYDFWRPITAIREGENDGNPDTEGDPSWLPLGAPGRGIVPDFTPPFPAYVSGHATFGAAAFKIFELFYGTNDVSYTLYSEEIDVSRNYTSFSQAAVENGRSRIYLGIHWDFDAVYGVECGAKVGEYVFKKALRPLIDADMDKSGTVNAEDLLLFQEEWHK